MKEDCVQDIYESLPYVYRKRLFRHCHNNDTVLATAIAAGICRKVPRLSLFFMWGIGMKDSIDTWDKKAMNMLHSILDHLKDFYTCEIDFCLVIAGSHGEMNGVPLNRRQSYSDSVIALAEAHGWQCRSLSSIISQGITKEFKKITMEEFYKLPYAKALIKSARRHYHAGSAEEGARIYVSTRLFERPILEHFFSESIMLSSSDWSLRGLQPNLPCFWIWSIQRGLSNKPWFMGVEKECVE